MTGYSEGKFYRQIYRRRQEPATPPSHSRPLPRFGERDPDEPNQDTYSVEMRRRLLAEIAASAPHVLRRLRDEVLRAKSKKAFDSFLKDLRLEASEIARDLRDTVAWWRCTPNEVYRQKHLRPLYPTIFPEAERTETYVRLYGRVDPREVARVARAHNQRLLQGEKTNRTSGKRHTMAIRWFVLHHFCGKKFSVIGKEFNKTGKAVEIGVKQMAHYFHIRPTPADKGGRPRGSKTRASQLRVIAPKN